MRSPRIGLAYSEPDCINACPAVENNHQCLSNPRWIEEDWPTELVSGLKLANNDLEKHWSSFDRDQKVKRSRTLLHGQVCSTHQPQIKRMHTLKMLRGFARDELKKSRAGRVRKATGWAGRKRPGGLNGHEIERSRQQAIVEAMEDDEPSRFLQGSPMTTTMSDSSPSQRFKSINWLQTSKSTQDNNSEVSPKATVGVIDSESILPPITPESSDLKPCSRCHSKLENFHTHKGTSSSRSPEDLMHQSHHLQNDNQIQHLEATLHLSELAQFGLRARNVSLARQNTTLGLELAIKDQLLSDERKERDDLQHQHEILVSMSRRQMVDIASFICGRKDL